MINIVVPIYGSVAANFFQFILNIDVALKDQKVAYCLDLEVGDSLITRARNSLITRYYNKTKTEAPPDYLLWLDSDIHCHPQQLIDMISRAQTYRLDAVGALVPIKGFTDNYFREPIPFIFTAEEVPEVFKDDPALLKADNLTTGCLLLSTKAVAALVRDAQKNRQWYHKTDGVSQPERHYDVFKTGIVDTVVQGQKIRKYLSEDWYICHKMQSLGIQLYADRSVKIAHRGIYDFSHPTAHEHAVIEDCRDYLGYLLNRGGEENVSS